MFTLNLSSIQYQPTCKKTHGREVSVRETTYETGHGIPFHENSSHPAFVLPFHSLFGTPQPHVAKNQRKETH